MYLTEICFGQTPVPWVHKEAGLEELWMGGLYIQIWMRESGGISAFHFQFLDCWINWITWITNCTNNLKWKLSDSCIFVFLNTYILKGKDGVSHERKNKSRHQIGIIQKCSTEDYVIVLVWMCISLSLSLRGIQCFPSKITTYSHRSYLALCLQVMYLLLI